ncbi:hypothetical protein AB0M39_27440 [Streptomyces sp. NPDC051907]|uniref:three-helix bundle dimerization domain-containing protein n=1 Tax=Streptomyces sp. NPDC051907 TaxID=3155284 RepID=UPI0034145E12
MERLKRAVHLLTPGLEGAVDTAHRELRTAHVQMYILILVERRAAMTLAAMNAAKVPETENERSRDEGHLR